MRDFTLSVYSQYVSAIKARYNHILRFDEYFLSDQTFKNFCLIRHDVDRKPENALEMAQLEYNLGVKSSYYFRAKPHAFHLDIIQKIADFGHEIGYHYESLSDANGNMRAALTDFEHNLKQFRKIVPIGTISMHGRPLKKYDNRDLWRDPNNKNILRKKHQILGELYLDIDYTDIVYITDTGRNWHSSKSNVRDTIDSEYNINFENGNELLNYLERSPHPKLVFQIHPERWNDGPKAYAEQYARDTLINAAKKIIVFFRKVGQKGDSNI